MPGRHPTARGRRSCVEQLAHVVVDVSEQRSKRNKDGRGVPHKGGVPIEKLREEFD